MKEKSQYLVVGLVIQLALVILVYGIFFLNDRDFRESRSIYHILFDQVSTLSRGDPVKINGVKLGKVLDLKVHNRQVLVSVDIASEVPIPEDSDIRVQNIGLMGERQVGIILGSSVQYARPRDTLTGNFDAGISEAMGFAGEVFDSTRIILSMVKRVLDSTVASGTFVPAFHDIIAKTQQLERDVQLLLREVSPLLKGSLQNLHVASEKLNAMLDENKEPIESLLTGALLLTDNANLLVYKVDTLTRNLEGVVGKLNSTDNTLGLLLNEDQLHQDLRRTLSVADSLFISILKHGLDVKIDFF
jgi:phospholipid/cholesterol/gamma-HCH transport system substrate-binding protein